MCAATLFRQYRSLLLYDVVRPRRYSHKCLPFSSLCSLGPSSQPADRHCCPAVWNIRWRLVSSDSKKPDAVSPAASVGGSILEKVFVDQEQTPVTASEKAKQFGKDASYMTILAVGVVVAGSLSYFIFRELFSSESANGVFSAALKVVKNSPEVADVIGTPMKGFGEETRRGRRRYASHLKFEIDGRECMRMKFYVQGPNDRGTVHLEVRKDDYNTFQYRYLFLQPDHQRHNTIILIDNR